jgi:hypothetical protein
MSKKFNTQFRKSSSSSMRRRNQIPMYESYLLLLNVNTRHIRLLMVKARSFFCLQLKWIQVDVERRRWIQIEWDFFEGVGGEIDNNGS